MELRYIDGLMGFVIGDILGLPVKHKRREDLLLNPVTKMIEDKNNNLPIGTWSDVTSTMIATIDSINNKNMVDLNDIAANYIAFKNHASFTPFNEVLGVDKVFYEAISLYEEDRDNPLKYGLDNDNSISSGSIVRVLPIAYYAIENKLSDYEILKLVEELSAMTHKNEICIMACYIYVRYVIFILNGKDKLSAYNMVRCVDYSMFNINTQDIFKRIIKDDISKYKLNDIYSSDNVVDTLEATLWVVLKSQSYKEALIGAINLGGNTNAIGALVGAVCGSIYGYDLIPLEWKEQIIRKEYLLDIFEEFSENRYE